MLCERRRLTVEWGQCDPAGIVFYPQYFHWFDASTAHLFGAAGLPPHTMFAERGIVGTPLVDVRAKFLAPSRFGDALDLECTISEWRRSSFVVEHRIFNGGLLAVEGAETRVWAVRNPDQPGRIKAVSIPPDVIARFA